MYVCVCIVRKCEGLESRLTWHHNLGVMETISSQIESTTTDVCGDWGGECKSVVLQGDCCVPAVALAEASAGWGVGGGGGGGGAKDKIPGVWS